MSIQDIVVIIFYAGGMLAIGTVLSKRNKNAVDMFTVNRQSPWWLTGLSAFMSAFSSGTFVVWGGIAFKHGAVAISILSCLGIASLLVGKYLAGKWAAIGIRSAGEFVEIRFGKQAVLFYTWAGMLFKIVAMAVALYSFSTLLSAMIDVPEGLFFRDDSTGKVSITYACIVSGLLMLSYAVSGGLWAVLIIDAVQFIVLMASVLFVVPLCFQYVGGVDQFLARVPDGFLLPVGGSFTYYFLAGWVIVHFFKLGGEWVFIQRFLAVSEKRNAQKSTYLLGVLYLTSPLLWMIPSMVYRVVDPAANPEYSYFLMCAAVLPAGMIGLLVAAMFSATASSIDGEVNVYAGALTRDLYMHYIRPGASQKEQVMIGRIFSMLIGALIIIVAVLIPQFGGAESVVLSITGLLAVSMVLPPVWGLFFPKVKENSVWVCSGVSLLVATLVKFTIPSDTSFGIGVWFMKNAQLLEVLTGIVVPFLVLVIMEWVEKNDHPGFLRIQQLENEFKPTSSTSESAIFPGIILAMSICCVGVLMFILAIFSEQLTSLMVFFGLFFVIISVLIFIVVKKRKVLAAPRMTGE